MIDRRSINLDITTKCTLACPECRRTVFKKRGMKINGGHMSFSDFKKVHSFFDHLTFCGGVSDPIFHPQFIEFLKLLKGRKTVIHTAASHKKEDWYRKAFEANTDAYWTFGIDGLPKDSHKYRINQDGEHLFKMACMAAKIVDKVKWQYIVFNYNEDNIEEARQMAKDNNLIFEVQKSSRFWEGDHLMTKNKKYYIKRKSYENPTKV